MKAEERIEALARLGWVADLERLATEHHVEPLEVCGGGRTPAVVSVRHGLWARMATRYTPGQIARLWRCAPSAVRYALALRRAGTEPKGNGDERCCAEPSACCARAGSPCDD